MAQLRLWRLAKCLLRYDDLIMRKYQIVGSFIELHEGLVEVNESQAKRRSAMLAPVGNGIYRIDNPVQFKVGEVIGIDYDPPKSLIDFMMPLELPEPVRAVEELPEVTEEVKPMIKHKAKK